MSLLDIVGGSSLLIFVDVAGVVQGVFTWALRLLWLNFPMSDNSVNQMINRIIVGLRISLLIRAILVRMRLRFRIHFSDFPCLAMFLYIFNFDLG